MADQLVTQPDGSVVDYDPSGHAVRQTFPDGTVTTFQYRAHEDYVATTGDAHVLYDATGHEIKQWRGNDESTASLYHTLGNGDFTLTDPDRTVTEYDETTGDVVRQTAPDGTVTTFSYRDDGEYVATTGDLHVLYDRHGVEIKQWEGTDEGAALTYTSLRNGDYTLTGPEGTVTEYTPQGRLVRQTAADGTVTTFQPRDNGSYVATTGDLHVLYNQGGDEIKQWTGGDEAAASWFTKLGGGRYSMTDPGGTTTTYNASNQPVLIQTPGKPDQTIAWNSDGSYVVTSDGMHYKYDANGMLIETWKGSDESVADHYRYLDNGDLVITTGDGSTTEYGPDGKPITTTTPEGDVINWKVDLGKLLSVANTTQTQRDLLETDLTSVKNVFTNIKTAWQSPAADSFELLTTDFDNAKNDLLDALDEAIRRLKAAHANYVAAEDENSSIISSIDEAGQKLRHQAGG